MECLKVKVLVLTVQLKKKNHFEIIIDSQEIVTKNI